MLSFKCSFPKHYPPTQRSENVVALNLPGKRRYVISASRIVNRKIVHWIVGFVKANSDEDLVLRLNVAKLAGQLGQLRISIYFTDTGKTSTKEKLLRVIQESVENIFHVSIPIDPASLQATDTKQLFTGEEVLARIKEAIS